MNSTWGLMLEGLIALLLAGVLVVLVFATLVARAAPAPAVDVTAGAGGQPAATAIPTERVVQPPATPAPTAGTAQSPAAARASSVVHRSVSCNQRSMRRLQR